MTLALSENRKLRIATLCALYFAQGVPWGFVAITLRAFFTEGGMDAVTLGGFLAIAHAPWAFKPLWAPVIDSVRYPAMGQRRPWILLAQGMMTLTVAAMLAVPDLVAQLTVLAWLVAVHNTFSALQDVATDAMAVDLLTEAERGRANGMMYGAKILGGAIGGAGMTDIVTNHGMSAALVLLTVVMCAAVLFPLVCVERPGERRFPWSPGEASTTSEPTTERIALLVFGLVRAFSMRATVVGGLVALGVSVGAGVLSVVGTVLYIQHLGWTKTMHANYSTASLFIGVLGSVAGGWLADRFGARRVIAGATVLLGGAWLVFGAAESMWRVEWFAGGLMIAEAVFLYALLAGFMTLFMQVSWPVVAATQFTVYMALLNASTTIGTAAGGFLNGYLDFQQLFLAAGALQLLLLVGLPLIDPQQTERELG